MTRPQPSEYHPFYNGYIQQVPEGNFLQLLKENSLEVKSFFNSIRKDKHDYRYQPGKWTVKQMLMHMSDTERVMSYRALTVARGDLKSNLPNMDENLFALHANVVGRTMEDILNEYMTVREATTLLFGYMNDEQTMYKGNVLGHVITPRALGYIIIGHAQHHMKVVRERYLK
jgi:DinB family protein